MHSKMIRIIWLSCFLFICHLGYSDDNYLTNPSFEDSGSNMPALNWTLYKDGYSRNNDFSLDGNWSCKITGNGSVDELGWGGAYTEINSGLPSQEKFTASSNIFISSYTQGSICGLYVTVNYTDSSQKIFNRYLTASEINSNLNTWKEYKLTFETEPGKTISSILFWCLVLHDNGNKFVGTVYFDDLKLEIFKPVLYWKGERIYSAIDRDQAAFDVLSRGFTHAVVSQHDNSDGLWALFLYSKGFDVVKNIGPTRWQMDFTPRYYSPYNDKVNYDNSKQQLTDMLNDFPEITGILDDTEDPPFPEVSYSPDGIASTYTFLDLEERIGNQNSQSIDWPVFKNWPVSGSHNVSSLTMENIEYNFPELVIGIGNNITGEGIIGYFGTGFNYYSYEMAAQTFKPASSRITRIDVMLRRVGNDSVYPMGNIYYFLTEVDVLGNPDLNNKVSLPQATIQASQIDHSNSSWNGIEPVKLYFDPVEIGPLDVNKKYALVLEFTHKNNADWNNAYYYVAGDIADQYSEGQALRLNNGTWIPYNNLSDLWMKVYEPTPPTGYTLNQFHEDWIDFQCAVIARYVEDYRDIANSASPIRKVWIYSGYTGTYYKKNIHNYDGKMRRSYSTDWQMLSNAGIDFAICGYGSKSVNETRSDLNAGNPTKPPKLIGGGYTPYGENSFKERYDTCDGAMLFYTDYYDNDPGWSIP